MPSKVHSLRSPCPHRLDYPSALTSLLQQWTAPPEVKTRLDASEFTTLGLLGHALPSADKEDSFITTVLGLDPITPHSCTLPWPLCLRRLLAAAQDLCSSAPAASPSALPSQQPSPASHRILPGPTTAIQQLDGLGTHKGNLPNSSMTLSYTLDAGCAIAGEPQTHGPSLLSNNFTDQELEHKKKAARAKWDPGLLLTFLKFNFEKPCSSSLRKIQTDHALLHTSLTRRAVYRNCFLIKGRNNLKHLIQLATALELRTKVLQAPLQAFQALEAPLQVQAPLQALQALEAPVQALQISLRSP